MKDFVIDLSKENIAHDDYVAIENALVLELSKKTEITKDEFSIDHFYDMGDFGGSKELHVLEISLPLDEDDLRTFMCKEREGVALVFDVEDQSKYLCV